MAKIKFNLNFGSEQIRTLDDLRDNFSIEDVLDVYNNGLLVKWLDVHNHKHELEKVNAIHATDARGILSELIKIFGISDDPEEIEESLSVLDYLEERKKVHEDMKAHGIPDYEKVKKERDELARQIEEMKEAQETETSEPEVHEEIHEEAPKPPKKTYDDLVQEIINNHKDLHHIYDCLDMITADYSDVLAERYSELFNSLYNSVPHVCYALLGHHATRPFYMLNQDDFDNIHENKMGLSCNPSDGTAWCLDGNDTDCKKLPASIHEKLRFTNILWHFSRNTLTSCDSVLPNVISKEYIFLKTFVYHYNPDRLRGDFEWTIVEPDNKKFMLFYGDGVTLSFDLSVASTYTHNKYMKTGLLSLYFPILNGIDALAVRGAFERDSEKGFCYMEAR